MAIDVCVRLLLIAILMTCYISRIIMPPLYYHQLIIPALAALVIFLNQSTDNQHKAYIVSIHIYIEEVTPRCPYQQCRHHLRCLSIVSDSTTKHHHPLPASPSLRYRSHRHATLLRTRASPGRSPPAQVQCRGVLMSSESWW